MDFRSEEGNVKRSLVSGKSYKKENANRQYLRSAKVCCLVHLSALACSRRSVEKSGRWATSGVWERKGEGTCPFFRSAHCPRVCNRLFVVILYDTQLKSDNKVATGHEMVREKILKGQETFFMSGKN